VRRSLAAGIVAVPGMAHGSIQDRRRRCRTEILVFERSSRACSASSADRWHRVSSAPRLADAGQEHTGVRSQRCAGAILQQALQAGANVTPSCAIPDGSH